MKKHITFVVVFAAVMSVIPVFCYAESGSQKSIATPRECFMSPVAKSKHVYLRDVNQYRLYPSKAKNTAIVRRVDTQFRQLMTLVIKDEDIPSLEYFKEHLLYVSHGKEINRDAVFLRFKKGGWDFLAVLDTRNLTIFIVDENLNLPGKKSPATSQLLKNGAVVWQDKALCLVHDKDSLAVKFGPIPAYSPSDTGWFKFLNRDASKKQLEYKGAIKYQEMKQHRPRGGPIGVQPKSATTPKNSKPKKQPVTPTTDYTETFERDWYTGAGRLKYDCQGKIQTQPRPDAEHTKWAKVHALSPQKRLWAAVGGTIYQKGESDLCFDCITRNYVRNIYLLPLPEKERIKILHEYHKYLDKSPKLPPMKDWHIWDDKIQKLKAAKKSS